MIAALIGLAAAFGTDPTPSGEAAVREMLDLSAKFCAPLYKPNTDLDVTGVLKAFNFVIPGSREDVESGPYKVSYIGYKKSDGSLGLSLRLVDGVVKDCTVFSPAKVWNQFTPSMPAYVKATGLPLVQDKDYDHRWRGGGAKVTHTVSGGNPGTLLVMERDDQ